MKQLFVVIVSIIMTSCYEEVEIPEPNADIFEVIVDVETENFLYDSRDTVYSIKSSEPRLLFNEQLVGMDDLRIRGKSARNFRRKSFSVFLNEPIYINNRYNTEVKKLTRFKLISLAMDYTYIENRISFGILQEAGLMPLFFKFVELKINDNTQGVYLLIEDPEQYFMELGSEYILRRGYNHYISDSEYIPQFYHKPEIDYKTRYLEIYDQLTTLNGLMLYDETASRINIEQYFHKMAIDYLLKNGDYTDEIFLYAQIEQDLIRYHIIPWDYDDIFKNKPHEVGLTWGTGKIYGDRYYETIEDIYDEIGDKLIFSIEDDLDYTIAMDSILYMKYTESFGQLLETVDEQLIERVFMETENELISFYNSYTVVEQSKYDRDKTDKELWMSNMEEKKTFLLDRLNETKSRLITENE